MNGCVLVRQEEGGYVIKLKRSRSYNPTAYVGEF